FQKGWYSGLHHGLDQGLRYGLRIGLSYWILLGLFQGVSRERIEDRFRLVPNQGIRRSLRNSVLMGMISAGVVGGVDILSFELSMGGMRSQVGLSFGIGVGICGALLVCAVVGGLSTLRHYAIRLLLWRAGSF